MLIKLLTIEDGEMVVAIVVVERWEHRLAGDTTLWGEIGPRAVPSNPLMNYPRID